MLRGMDNTENSTPDPGLPTPPGRRKKLALVAAGLTLAVPLGAVAWNTAAGASSMTDDDPIAIEDDADGEFVCATEAPAPEDMAEWNAEADDLAVYLDEKGIAYTMESDETGSRWVEWDYEDDAASDAVDAFYAERYPLTPEEIAEINADEDALAAFLDERGVTYTVDESPDGTHMVEYDDEDEDIVSVIDDFYAERYPLTPEEVAEYNAEADALVAAFDAAGITYTIDTDAAGVRWIEWDYEDDAANDVADTVYQELYPEDALAC
jgi:hypothetical protein